MFLVKEQESLGDKRMKDLKLYQRLEEIDVVRKQDGKTHVLGAGYRPLFYDNYSYLHHIVHDTSTMKILKEESKTFKYDSGFGLINAVLTSIIGVGIPFLIYELRGYARMSRKRTKAHFYNVKEFKKRNLEDLTEAIKDIKVYQGSLEDVERIDTGNQENFIRANDTFDLRVKAYLLGADAVMEYQPGSSIGTPVKFKK